MRRNVHHSPDRKIVCKRKYAENKSKIFLLLENYFLWRADPAAV